MLWNPVRVYRSFTSRGKNRVSGPIGECWFLCFPMLRACSLFCCNSVRLSVYVRISVRNPPDMSDHFTLFGVSVLQTVLREESRIFGPDILSGFVVALEQTSGVLEQFLRPMWTRGIHFQCLTLQLLYMANEQRAAARETIRANSRAVVLVKPSWRKQRGRVE